MFTWFVELNEIVEKDKNQMKINMMLFFREFNRLGEEEIAQKLRMTSRRFTKLNLFSCFPKKTRYNYIYYFLYKSGT